jgi:hypothetical protein
MISSAANSTGSQSATPFRNQKSQSIPISLWSPGDDPSMVDG